jgi:hypothetical protein
MVGGGLVEVIPHFYLVGAFPVGVEWLRAELQVSPLRVRKKRERSGRDDRSISTTNRKTAALRFAAVADGELVGGVGGVEVCYEA